MWIIGWCIFWVLRFAIFQNIDTGFRSLKVRSQFWYFFKSIQIELFALIKKFFFFNRKVILMFERDILTNIEQVFNQYFWSQLIFGHRFHIYVWPFYTKSEIFVCDKCKARWKNFVMSGAVCFCVLFLVAQVLLVFNQSNHRELPGAIFMTTNIESQEEVEARPNTKRQIFWSWLIATGPLTWVWKELYFKNENRTSQHESKWEQHLVEATQELLPEHLGYWWSNCPSLWHVRTVRPDR